LSVVAQTTAGLAPAPALIPRANSAASRTPKVLQTGVFYRRLRR